MNQTGIMRSTPRASAMCLQRERTTDSIITAFVTPSGSRDSSGISETYKPWMAMLGDVLTSGYAGDYGVQRVWAEGIRGQGVKVGVNDNGLVRGHADFDYSRIDDSGYFLPAKGGEIVINAHATAVASVIGARADGQGVVGVAHESHLWSGDYLSPRFVKVAIDAGCDVINNSWGVGPEGLQDQFHYRVFFNSEFNKAAQGRKGLGSSLVCNAGNGRAIGADTAVQVSNNHENVITVAAVDIDTRISDFSTPGEAVHIAALGALNVMANANDLTGATLYAASGTSFAVPFVSGVVALIYQANAGLGLRDVQEILAYSASLPHDGIDGFAFNGGTQANGGGLHFSRDYGFGLVNAYQAVRLAQSWLLGADQARTARNRAQSEINTYQRWGDGGQRFTLKFNMAEAREVEHVKLRLELDLDDINDIKIELVSPLGTKSMLMDNYGDQATVLRNVIDLGSRRFWGDAESENDRYVYTDAFNALAAADPKRLLLDDRDGGNDTFNAACLTGHAEIDLGAAHFRFADGPQGRIAAGTVIRNVIGGDGNDTLRGSARNELFDGGAGDNLCAGGAGDDTYIVNDAGDRISELADNGIDTVMSSLSYILGAHLENLLLTGTDKIDGEGNALDNFLRGNAADNRLDGGYGDDTLMGGDGNDIYFVAAGDVVADVEDAGIDTVISEASWILGSDQEYLMLAGAEANNASGNALDNFLIGNGAVNILTAAAGDDLLRGCGGNDLLDGGEGNDSLRGGGAAELYIGGAGDDSVSTGTGSDIVLFNAGDGRDSLAADGRGGAKTLSLGGGFACSDLSLAKTGNNLTLRIGAADQISFRNWYAETLPRPIVSLQLIAEAMVGFAASGSDPLLDQKIECFDFNELAGAFDVARAATPTLSTWALSNALLTFQLVGSDSAAIGGELAYQYGRHGTLARIDPVQAQEVLSDSAFGVQAQRLRPLACLQEGLGLS